MARVVAKGVAEWMGFAGEGQGCEACASPAGIFVGVDRGQYGDQSARPRRETHLSRQPVFAIIPRHALHFYSRCHSA
jgi:hypothetical protein